MDEQNRKEKIIPRVEGELIGGTREQNHPVESWRIFKIMAEFVNGFELLRKYDSRSVTFFGSARCKMEDVHYRHATELSRRLAENGFTIITGGASGIMEAANKGAYEAGGESVGLNIELPREQHGNRYLTDEMKFHYFFSRKVMLSFASEVYVYFPGGIGTLDEFFELMTLIQTKKIRPIPIVLFGSDYWNPLLEWMRTVLLEKHQTINPEDLEIYHLVDSVDEAYHYITEQVDNYCKSLEC